MLQRNGHASHDRIEPNDFVSCLSTLATERPDGIAFIYLADGEQSEIRWTFGQLDQQARAIAQRLQSSGMEGERAILLFPPGLDFIASLFGCFYAGVVAVPAYPPRRNRNVRRIHTIAKDANAKVAITVRDQIERIDRFIDDAPQLRDLDWFAADGMDLSSASQWIQPEIHRDSLAVLQYTSGSTGSPKGVMLTHGNLIANCAWITEAFGTRKHEVGLSWLPMYHDMGLVGGVLNPIFVNCPNSGSECFNLIMSPTAFLQKPARWLEAISRYQVSISGGPNFAYDYCTKKITEEESERMDLGSWEVAFNGAEPVRASTIQNFSRRFARCGFRQEAFYPCYGMAESTLMITGNERYERPVSRCFDGPRLDDRDVVSVEPIDPNARQLVGCGRPAAMTSVRIVDPETRRECPLGRVGEIWVSGASVARGYLNQEQITEETFCAKPAGLPSADTQHLNYLRTGDLGFFHDGQLFVTGRLKDLIIVRGVNRYPQDIELTIEQSDERLRTGAAAAFAVEMDGRERLILVSEVERVADNNWDEVIGAVRRNVTATHELAPDGILLIRAGSIPKTSSGKIQRHACRAGFLENSLMVIADWFNWNKDGKHRLVQKPQKKFQDYRDDGSSDFDTPPHPPSRPGVPSDGEPPLSPLDAVYEAIREVGKERITSELNPESNITSLGLDSLERLEIATVLETRYGRLFPESVLQEIETCGQVATAVTQHLLEPLDQNLATGEILPETYRFDAFPEYVRLQRTREAVLKNGIKNPFFNLHQGVTRDTTVINGQTFINYSSYNYLGMSGAPEVTAAAQQAITDYGSSCSASRIVSGEKPVHRELESAIAKLLGVDNAITYVGGHATNETTIGHLCSPSDIILHDALSHNSILQGALLSGAQRRPFPHNDWKTLDVMLGKLRRDFRRALIIVEGVYSMDGDFPDLAEFIKIKKKHHALLMVDEAHSIGTMGANGRGIAEHTGVNPRDVDIWMGTLSKAFGSCGGYIAGDAALIELLKYTSPGFVYSVGLPPSNAAAALASLRLLEEQPERAERCRERARLFLNLARKAGFNTGASAGTPIVPVITGSSALALGLSQELLNRSINVQPILYPAVEESAARLRFFISSEHSPEQIRYTVNAMQESMNKILATPSVSSPAASTSPATSEPSHQAGGQDF